MSNINQLATSNTFSQWLTGTQELISKMNSLTDGGNGSTFLSNTNIEIANNVTIGGNLTVSGNITLDAIGFDDLIVAGGATIGTTLDVVGQTSLTNLTISGNVATINVTSQAEIGGDANIYGNLYVGGNTVFGGNVTLDIVGFNDLNVAGKLTVSGNTELTNISANYGNFTSANVIVLVGDANTAIYSNISTVNAYSISAGSYANSAFAAANNASADGLAFAIALG